MDYSVLEKSTLFQGVEANVLRGYLEETPHHIQCYDKEETIFHLMDPALRIGIILEGSEILSKRKPGQCFRSRSRRNDRACRRILEESAVPLRYRRPGTCNAYDA